MTGRRKKKENVIDGGYVSWTYGSREFSWTIWSKARERYIGSILLLDSRNSLRKQFFPDYKSHREERLDEDKRARLKLMVRSFEKHLERDDGFRNVRFLGLEADDLVALYAMRCKTLRVLGADKDLLQLNRERIHIERIDGTELLVSDIHKKYPKTLSSYISEETDVLLTLAIMGDKSDDVPRLLGLRDFDTMIQILKSDRPFTTAHDIFGLDFERNLALTVLPCPFIFSGVALYELPTMLDEGSYPMDIQNQISNELDESLEEALWQH